MHNQLHSRGWEDELISTYGRKMAAVFGVGESRGFRLGRCLGWLGCFLGGLGSAGRFGLGDFFLKVGNFF